jgi:hypothetical protein
VTITLPGYQIETREVTVGSGPIEMLPILLRPTGGTLMLSSTPAGAYITVDGKKIDGVTPTQLQLALGTYTVTLEKDGLHATERIEIKTGINYHRIALGQ